MWWMGLKCRNTWKKFASNMPENALLSSLGFPFTHTWVKAKLIPQRRWELITQISLTEKATQELNEIAFNYFEIQACL